LFILLLLQVAVLRKDEIYLVEEKKKGRNPKDMRSFTVDTLMQTSLYFVLPTMQARRSATPILSVFSHQIELFVFLTAPTPAIFQSTTPNKELVKIPVRHGPICSFAIKINQPRGSALNRTEANGPILISPVRFPVLLGLCCPYYWLRHGLDLPIGLLLLLSPATAAAAWSSHVWRSPPPAGRGTGSRHAVAPPWAPSLASQPCVASATRTQARPRAP
jgi:hypothetical protein